MTPLERAARVMLALGYPEAIGTDAEERYWDRRGEEYMAQARAVLTAIREPSEGMKQAGEHDDCSPPGEAGRYISEDMAGETFTRMIDAMLAEGE